VGIPWCSGPVALLAAGHLLDFFGVIARLSEMGKRGRHLALLLVLCAYASNEPNNMRGPFLGFRRFRRYTARSALTGASVERNLIDSAWAAHRPTLGAAVRRGVLPDFALAFEIVGHTRVSESIRMVGATAILVKWAQDFGASDHREAVNELSWLSPLYMLKIPGRRFEE